MMTNEDNVNFDFHTDYVTCRYGEKAKEENVSEIEGQKKQELRKLKCLYRYRGKDELHCLICSLRRRVIPKCYLSNPNTFNDPYDFRIPNIIKISDSFRRNIVTHLYLMSEREKRVNPENLPTYKKELYDTLNIGREFWDEWMTAIHTIETKYKRNYTESLEKFKKYVENKAREEHREMVRRMRDEIGVTCFSERKDSLVMWSHYAQNHQGICIEYSADAFFENITGAKHAPIEFLYPVRYSDDIHHLVEQTRKYYDEEEMTEFEKGNLIFEIGLTKAEEWKPEAEWRFILHIENPENGEDPRIMTLRPSKIYLGSEISDENKKTLVDVCRAKAIPVDIIQMRLNEEKFKLEEEILYSGSVGSNSPLSTS